MALVAAAINDSTIAAWDSKYVYMRQRPYEIDPTVTPAVAPPGSPSYPSDYAAVAGAAASVLSYLFPDHSSTFDSMATEAAQSRLLAGLLHLLRRRPLHERCGCRPETGPRGRPGGPRRREPVTTAGAG